MILFCFTCNYQFFHHFSVDELCSWRITEMRARLKNKFTNYRHTPEKNHFFSLHFIYISLPNTNTYSSEKHFPNILHLHCMRCRVVNLTSYLRSGSSSHERRNSNVLETWPLACLLIYLYIVMSKFWYIHRYPSPSRRRTFSGISPLSFAAMISSGVLESHSSASGQGVTAGIL